MTKAKNPDTKNNEKYNKLREEGMDKRKAARVVNYTDKNKGSSAFPDESQEKTKEEE